MTPAEIGDVANQVAELVVTRLANQRRLTDRYELSEIIGISVPTIERLQRKKVIPIIRVGRRVLYDPDQVVAALAAASASTSAAQGCERKVAK